MTAALAAGCASDPPTLFTPARDAGTPRVDGALVGGGDSGAVTPIPIRDAGAAANCSEAAQLVYVLSDQNDLYSFRPNLRRFTRIGALGCPRSAGSPNSMAIDRDAVAWVNYVQGGLGDSAGAIYRVNTADASCSSAAPIRMPAGWYRLGMGFSTVSADDTAENLFVAGTADPLGGGSQGLGSVETGRGLLHIIGNFSGAFRGQSAELTGTGDGRLFGFFTTTPVQVAQLDRATGAVLDATPLPGVETPQAWAFSFWGGDFYLYTAPSAALSGRTTNVTRYRPSDGSIDARYMTDIGFRIVGAGVSTCAPIAPPP
jgi:hypothetical protein